MLFSSTIFLFLFLPIVFILYQALDVKYKNKLLLVVSILFYSWGEPKYVVLMLSSIVMNYCFGLFIYNEQKKRNRDLLLAVCIFSNLGVLGYFKYWNFIVGNINTIFRQELLTVRQIVLPIGISFYTFQALSYVVDIYRSKEAGEIGKVQKNIFDLALYISFFPQLIAGPIVKYYEVEEQIKEREVNTLRVAYGIKRFIYGLSKKVLISNTFAYVADQIFAIPVADVSTSVAWLGAITYSLQIYFDFSGYSDMAIGLGEMFGFTFMENFNYPYISKSIQEFWRRWHISLSTWFKEYLYIPLGGNRKGNKRTYINLMIVFIATGIWHGASWNFIVWGIYYGIFLVIERAFLGKKLEKCSFKWINHIYVVTTVIIGWVIFRAETMNDAIRYIANLFIINSGKPQYNLAMYCTKELIITLIIGIFFSGIIQQKFTGLKEILYRRQGIHIIEAAMLFILLQLSIMNIVSGTYNPFIYFRF